MNIVGVLIVSIVVVGVGSLLFIDQSISDSVPKIPDKIEALTIKDGRYYSTGKISYLYGSKFNIIATYIAECIGGVVYFRYDGLHSLIDPNGLPILCNMPEGFIIEELK